MGSRMGTRPGFGLRTSAGLSELIIVARGGPLFIDLETDAYTTFEIRDAAARFWRHSRWKAARFSGWIWT